METLVTDGMKKPRYPASHPRTMPDRVRIQPVILISRVRPAPVPDRPDLVATRRQLVADGCGNATGCRRAGKASGIGSATGRIRRRDLPRCTADRIAGDHVAGRIDAIE